MPARKRRPRRRLGDAAVSIEAAVSPHATKQMLDERAAIAMASQGKRTADVRDRLERILSAIDPVVALASLFFHTQAQAIGEAGEWGEVEPIFQFHCELAQFAALRQPLGDARRLPTAEDLDEMLNAVRDLSWIDPVAEKRGSNGSESSKQSRLDDVRVDAQVVRNWAPPSVVERYATEIWAPLEADVARAIGVKAGELVSFLFQIGRECDRRLNAHFRRTVYVRSAKSPASALKQLQLHFPALVEAAEAAGLGDDLRNTSRVAWDRLLTPFLDQELGRLLPLTLDELMPLYPGTVTRETLVNIMNRLSFGFGELADEPFEEAMVDNPVRTRPFARLDATYALIVPPLVQSFGLQLVEALVADDEALIQRYRKRRARFLESEAERLFRDAFPGATIYANASWHPEGALSPHETDLIVVIDDTILIVELKSNAVRPAARRGAEGSVEDALERLIVEPSQQSGRFEEHLKSSGLSAELIVDRKHRILDLTHIRSHIRLTVTLELLGMWAKPAELADTGLLPHQDVEFMRPIALSHLALIFELLPLTAQRVDFLERRLWFDRNFTWIGDDLDLLALYLEALMRIDPHPPNSVFYLAHRSIVFDPFVRGREVGISIRPPTIKLPAPWHATLERVEEHQEPGWLRVSRAVLSVPLTTQRRAAKEIEVMRRRVSSNGVTGEYKIYRDTEPNEAALCFFAFEDGSSDFLLQQILADLEEVLDKHDVPDFVAVFGFTPRHRLPQLIVGMERPPRLLSEAA